MSLDGRLDFGACAQRRACIVAGAGGVQGCCAGCGQPAAAVLARLVLDRADQLEALLGGQDGVEW